MSLFFLNDPIRESDRSILNNSILDDNKCDLSDDGEDYSHSFTSAAFPGFFFGYPPYAYPTHLHSNAATTAKPNTKTTAGKSNTKSSVKGQSSYHPFDKDVYKLVDFRPKNNLCEDEKNYYIQIDLPGMSKEQIHMELTEDNIISISGERAKKNNVEGMKYSKMECEYGKFSRSFSIPETGDIEKIEAKMENGVLEVIIPKISIPKTQRRTILVQ
ncbi:HSP20-like chaperone [Piromyces finnis]|uniref:HSP20-like chaperone n=2 Tax=Piromyces finnis TaxID=1754191 RepID=A0A1Y1V472_9FUNG|nr:HSP20-like chaperone [Piromyces finnis]|eukprot:ORX46245.1 HSP20-like chaperone [Piromyces finnis]